VDVHAVDFLALRRSRPARDQQMDAMAAQREPAEDLVQVRFGPACLRIQAVLPVGDQDVQPASPVRRMSASSTPLTNRALSAEP
jgi:hypothetical protein